MNAVAAALLGVGPLLLTAKPLKAQGGHEGLLEEIEKEIARTVERPYSLSGFLEFQPILFDLDRDAAFYRLNFYDRDERDLLAQYNFRSASKGRTAQPCSPCSPRAIFTCATTTRDGTSRAGI
jgi:hypothetical protein